MTKGFTQLQSRLLALFPKVTGWTSAFASFTIVVSILRQPKRTTLTYILLGLSMTDFICSLWIGLSTWPIPKDNDLDVTWASGSPLFCTMQGFFVQMAITSPLYNASLSLYYLLVIRYGWKETSIEKVRLVLLTTPLFWGLGTSIASLALQELGNSVFWCWIEDELYQFFFFYLPLWLAVVVVTVSCSMIYLAVRKAEAASRKYRLQGSTTTPTCTEGHTGTDSNCNDGTPAIHNTGLERSMKARMSVVATVTPTDRTRTVATQCFCFAGAFYLAWLGISVRSGSMGCVLTRESNGRLSTFTWS